MTVNVNARLVTDDADDLDVIGLRAGDVVAVRPRHGLSSPHGVERLAEALKGLSEKTGVMFVVFEDVDLIVFQPKAAP